MDTERRQTVQTETEREALLREGREVLASLGGRRLVKEFSRRAAGAASREELAELLLEYLTTRRPG